MSRKGKIILLCVVIFIAVPTYYTLAFGRLAINGTESLRANAFILFTWPKTPVRGLIAAVEMPDILAARLPEEELYLTKRIVGLPGDPVETRADTVCVNDYCVAALFDGATPISPLWHETEVPAQQIAIFGDTDDSLDSRYEIIGAVPIEDIVAVGFAIPFPHWTDLQELIQ